MAGTGGLLKLGRELYEAGSPLRSVARLWGCGKATARARLLAMGVVMRPRGMPPRVTLAPVREWMAQCRAEGWTFVALARHLKCYESTVRNALGVKGKTRGNRHGNASSVIADLPDLQVPAERR